MKYEVKSTAVFERQAKNLAKKYASLKNELQLLRLKLEVKPDAGVAIGENCYKIRMAIASKGKGKAGGARIITNFFVKDSTVYLLAIYDKSEKNNITDKELLKLLEYLP
jgi:hypothetical protein